jgi:hypothetical protein
MQEGGNMENQSGQNAYQNPSIEVPSDRNSVSPPPVPKAPAEPAEFPRGFWARVDYLLQHPEAVIASLKGDVKLWEIARVFFVISLAMAALYGAVMGATNLLQAAPVPLAHKLLAILSTAVRVPVLYLATLAIVLPPIYVSNAFVGARLSVRQMVASALGAMALTVTVLGSMATIAAFFALTTRSYSFIKLLHVVIFAYAGLAGLWYLGGCMKAMLPKGPKRIPQGLFVLWLVLYMFVGTQMAWVLRPFVGSPDQEFRLFRPRVGNFYESVLYSVENLLNDED